jgi:orotidine-5'-phosphate decarboxylase
VDFYQQEIFWMRASALAVAEVPRRVVPLEERLIVALDVPNRERAFDLVKKLGDTVQFYKIGLQLQFAGGLQVADELIKQGKKVFLDSKICDIEETVRGAVASVANMGVDFLTVHGNGKSIQAALEGRKSHPLKILSVTVLTSLDAHDMADLGLSCSVEDLVMMRARKALDAGCDGVIASGKEAHKIRELAGDRLLIVTPGIRSKNVPHHDQKRVATPNEAIAAGADYLVVGREILENSDPKRAAIDIFNQIKAALPY